MEDHKSRVDGQWNAAIPRGWCNPKGWGANRQERRDLGMHSGEREMLYDILDKDDRL